MALVYMTLENALDIHTKTIDISGGGLYEHIDIGKLESVLEHIKNDDYYPSFEEKLTHLFFCACKFHCFADGNKRIAIVLAAQFLLLNGYLYVMESFFSKMENISYHVAAGRIDKVLLHEILCATLNGSDDDEELKLKIIDAIKN
jgi:death-on-curing protein